MKLKDAIASLSQEHPEDTLNPLYTPWGEQIKNEENPQVWQEYPRPQLRRQDFHMLNGKWQYLITSEELQPGQPLETEGEILVPFSPETLLSGVNRQLQPGEYLWYERTLSFSQEELAKKAAGMRCILHFGAVDQQAAVYADGREIAVHIGGYLPFSADLTDFVSDRGTLLQVWVRDDSDTSYYTRGKQTLKRGGMFYTAQSGIWQSVWYEWVPKNYVTDLRITPCLDSRQVIVEMASPKPFIAVTCTIQQADRQFCFDPVGTGTGTTAGRPTKVTRNLIGVAITMESSNAGKLILTLPEDGFRPWTPEEPWIYGFTIAADEDVVHSYFAMRSYSVEPDEKGIPRFCLNHRPYFLHGLLDQGYWSDGLMTAPCDEAFLYDIKLAKDMGFNMLRKHIKVEPLRWYYHCDRLGMIVWQDMVSGGTTYHMPLVCYMPTLFPHISAHTKDHHYHLFARADEEGRAAWEQECLDTIDHLYSIPSIAVWVPFNEGWGQFDAARIADLVKEKDPTRPVDHASGWFDQKGGDFRSIHNYFRPLKVKLDGKRAFVISEYGGFACHIPEHSSVDRVYGYRKYATPKEMTGAYRELIEKHLFSLVDAGLSGAVYTQLSDIEEEVNGLVTYDRRVVKIDLTDSKSEDNALL
ncbi:MAG: glycoside hydrolase family 2 [Acetatifactor sp.]|nr:glycoside hydrolase family 2 [Acetatifactor sp.]